MWEQVAIDLLLANIDQPVWSWADARSVDALDFWAQLDTNIRFVLLCQTPQQAVAELFTADVYTVPDEARQLAVWQQRHQALLRFHLRHPERSVLVGRPSAATFERTGHPHGPAVAIAFVTRCGGGHNTPLLHNAVQLQLAAQLVALRPIPRAGSANCTPAYSRCCPKMATQHTTSSQPRPHSSWCSTTCN